MNNFDQHGWYTSADNGREAAADPPIYSETATPGEDRANWTGKRWVVVPYVAPVPVEPSVAVPDIITPRQGMLILARHGILPVVQAMLDAMEGLEAIEARIDFERANEWRRDWPLLNAMATAAGISQEQIDQLFIEASVL